MFVRGLLIDELLYFILSTQGLCVTDGDTINLNGEKIRLMCLDALEKTQPFGLEAFWVVWQFMIAHLSQMKSTCFIILL